MPTLYDVAHLVAWNGYAKDMLPYIGVDKASLNNDEFWFPYVINQLYGKEKATRIHILCKMAIANYKNYQYALNRIKQLLSYGANPDIKNIHDCTPLLECCNVGGHFLKSIIKVLINAGADVNNKCIQRDYTPLYFAARIGKTDIVELLLHNKASVNTPDIYGAYPIDAATRYVDTVKVLFENGAVITDKTFHRAITAMHSDTLSFLCKHRKPPAGSIILLKDTCERFMESSIKDTMYRTMNRNIYKKNVYNDIHRKEYNKMLRILNLP